MIKFFGFAFTEGTVCGKVEVNVNYFVCSYLFYLYFVSCRSNVPQPESRLLRGASPLFRCAPNRTWNAINGEDLNIVVPNRDSHKSPQRLWSAINMSTICGLDMTVAWMIKTQHRPSGAPKTTFTSPKTCRFVFRNLKCRRKRNVLRFQMSKLSIPYLTNCRPRIPCRVCTTLLLSDTATPPSTLCHATSVKYLLSNFGSYTVNRYTYGDIFCCVTLESITFSLLPPSNLPPPNIRAVWRMKALYSPYAFRWMCNCSLISP